MSLLIDMINGFLMMVIVIWVSDTATFFVLGKTDVALVFLFVSLIPLLVLTYQYLKFIKRKQKLLILDRLKQILILVYGACFACWIFDVGSTYYAIDVLGVASELNPLGWPLGSLGALVFYLPALTFTYFLLYKRVQRYASAVAFLITALTSYLGIMNLSAGFSNFSFFAYSAVLSSEVFWFLLCFVTAADYTCIIAFIKLMKQSPSQRANVKVDLSTIAVVLGGIALIAALAQPTYSLFIASQNQSQPSFELAGFYVAYTYSYAEIRNNGSATANDVAVTFCFFRRLNASFVDSNPEWAVRAKIAEIKAGDVEILTMPTGRYQLESTFSGTNATDYVVHLSLSCVYKQNEIHATFDLDDFEIFPWY